MDIDLKKHVMYSPLMEKIVREHLEKKYPKEALDHAPDMDEPF